MATLTITVPDVDLPRLTAAATAANSTPKQLVIDYLKAVVSGFESQQHAQQFATGYTPIGGS